jgi:hypothetical protein
MYVCMYVRTYVGMYLCMYVCMFIIIIIILIALQFLVYYDLHISLHGFMFSLASSSHTTFWIIWWLFIVAWQSNSNLDRLVVGVSRLQTGSQPVVLLWTSDQQRPLTTQHTTNTKD